MIKWEWKFLRAISFLPKLSSFRLTAAMTGNSGLSWYRVEIRSRQFLQTMQARLLASLLFDVTTGPHNVVKL